MSAYADIELMSAYADIPLVFRLFDSLGIGVEAADATSLGDPAGAAALDAVLDE